MLGEDGELSYGRLEKLANGLACQLVERLGPGRDAVALDLPQGTAFVVKSGKSFVPLDRRRPESAGAILDACQCALVLHDVGEAPTPTRPSLVVDPWRHGSACADSPPAIDTDGDTRCYVYYTTGTTGNPKGVVDIHRNVLHNAWRYTVSLSPRADDRFSMIQSPSFSGCLSSLFTSLLNGATLCPFDLAGHGLAPLAHWVRAAGITIFHSVPSIFQCLARPDADYPGLRIVRLEGDRATPASIEAWRAHCPPDSRLVIGLGATECGLARRFEVDRARADTMGLAPLGYPCPDVDVHIEDDDGAALPPGEIGEIVVESDYLATGYLGRDDLTATAFRKVDTACGRRRYRTGDLGYLDADGCLHHVARKGDALRINGTTIDPAPIECAVLATGMAVECALGLHVDERGTTRLVLYYVPAHGGDAVMAPLAMNRALAGKVPGDRLPGWIVALDALPVSADGKVARDRLRPPSAAHRVRPEAGVAPRTGIERVIADAWQSVLGYPLDDVHQDIFELGVDSLACIQFLEALERSAGLRPGIERVFDHPSVAALANDLGRGRERRVETRVAGDERRRQRATAAATIKTRRRRHEP